MATPKTIVIRTIPGNMYSTSGMATTDVLAEPFPDSSSPRKRKRLTHLSPDERLMRRKLKNRVAAQTARDRKRVKMDKLEDAVAALEAVNRKLRNENHSLKHQTGTLSTENKELRAQLGMQPESVVVTRKGLPSLESAEGQDGSPLPADDALFSTSDDNDDLLQKLLSQINEESCEETDDSSSQSAGDSACEIHVVGPTAKELESINELIKFDHVYYKAETDVVSSGGVPDGNQAVSKSSKVQPTSANSLLKTTVVQAPPAPPSIPAEDGVAFDDNFNLPQTLEDVDFAALGGSLEQQLIDFDAILQDSIAMETSSAEKASDISEPLPKKRKLCESDFVQEIQVKIEPDALPEDLFSQSSELLAVPRSPVLARNSISDSGYSSEMSDAASPRSDVSVLHDHDSAWEESFTELFPSLL